MLKSVFTFFDLIAVFVIIMLIAGLVFPSIQASREAARRHACMDKLRQIGAAIHQYHEVNEALPGHKVGPGSGNRISAFTHLLPYLGHQNIYDELVEQRWRVPWERKKKQFDDKGNVIRDANGQEVAVKDAGGQDVPSPYCTPVPIFLCPEDSAGLTKKTDELGFNNYVFSHGDWITGQDEKFTRGPFVPETKLTFDDIVDGMSNTLAMSERSIASNKRTPPDASGKIKEYVVIATTQGNIVIAKEDTDTEKPDIARCFQRSNGDLLNEPEKLRIDRNRAGTRWADGQHLFTTMNTILPPNGTSCLWSEDDKSDSDRKPVIAPPTSYHITGANVLMLDGQTRFIVNKIGCGGGYADKKCVKEGQSPFGVWGAMGSIADTKPIEVHVGE